MSWTAPRTWVADQIVLASELNTDVRDNLNEAALHDHSGGSGSGTRALGGVGTGLTVLYLRDGAGPGTPTGTISAVFTTGSRLAMHSSGGTVVLFATSGHEHGITQAQSTGTAPTGGTAAPSSSFATFMLYKSGTVSTVEEGTLSRSIAIGGTGRRSLAVTGGFTVIPDGGGSATFVLRFYREATAIQTSTFTWGAAVGGTLYPRLIATGMIDPTLASGTYSYSVTVTRFNQAGITFWLGGAFIDVQEIRVP